MANEFAAIFSARGLPQSVINRPPRRRHLSGSFRGGGATMKKRSVTLGGHRTSVSLEDAFWKALREIAERWHVAPSELIAEINANRKEGNLSSAIRLFVLEV